MIVSWELLVTAIVECACCRWEFLERTWRTVWRTTCDDTTSYGLGHASRCCSCSAEER